MAMVLCVSCKKDDGKLNGGGTGGGTQTVATVTTNDVTDITQTTAVCGGEVKSENGWAVTERGVCWSIEPSPTPSDNCTVDGDGIGKFTSEITGLEPDTKYYVRAYAKNAAGTSFGAEKSFTTLENGGGSIGGHEYVDLGLPNGTLWATCNVGASSPEDYGDYFAWGETTAKSKYDWSTYKYMGYDNWGNSYITKYNTNSIFGIVDNKDVLEMADDAAHVNWGGSWRMPTHDERQELISNCNLTWTTLNGVSGYRFANKNDNNKFIFLPAAGCYYEGSLDYAGSGGYYWSSSLDTGTPIYAYNLYFSNGLYMFGGYRCYGQSVRPVLATQK